MGADVLSEKAIETRQKMLDELADTHILFIGTHFANPVAGYVLRSGENFVFNTLIAS